MPITRGDQKAYPLIRIAFHVLDLPLANLIQTRLGGGVVYQGEVNWVVLAIIEDDENCLISSQLN